MYTIYLIEDHRNKPYVGMTSKTPEERFRVHITDAKCGSDTHFHRAIRKYGPKKFEIIPLDTSNSHQEALALERQWVKRLGAYKDWGYNMTRGGDTNPMLNPIVQQKANEAKRGQKLSKEHRQKLSEALSGENHPLYGKQHSEESRRKMSESSGKLSRQSAAEVKFLALEEQMLQPEIAEIYDITQSNVSVIKREKRWEHVEPKRPEWYDPSKHKNEKAERARNIKYLLENSGWMQKTIANQAGVDRSTVSGISIERHWCDAKPQQPEWLDSEGQLTLFQ